MEIGKNWLLTNQKIESENIEYLWSVEPGACETCLALDGTVYQSANDIPSRPHPNCKCHILPVEKDVPTTDPIEQYKKKRREEQRNELLLAKLYGDALSLEQEIDEYNKRIDELEEDIEDFEQDVESHIKSINKSNIEEDEEDNFQGQKGYVEISHYTNEEIKPKLDELKNQVDYAKYKGEKAKKEVVILKNDIESIRKEQFEDRIDVVDKLHFAKIIIEEYVVKNLTKEQADRISNILSNLRNFKEATAFWHLSSSKFAKDKANIDYLLKNGYIYQKIEDLHNTNLEKEIKSWLKKDTGKENCKVLLLHSESSMAKTIINDNDFRKFIKENISELKTNKYIQEKNIIFNNGDTYNSMHGAKVKDIQIDYNDNIKLRIEDLYNFEPGRTSVRGRLGEKFQNADEIEIYYVIVKIELPKKIWIKF